MIVLRIFVINEMPTFGPFLETMDFPKFSAKISMSFDAPREISPHSVSPHH
jgi:hypothetical protein